jgi:CrcB protein
MILYLSIALGSALGGVSRFALSEYLIQHLGDAFPWSTLIVNVTGSFAIGFFATLTEPHTGRWIVGPDGRLFFMVGVCGGYTTFSAFSLRTVRLAQDGEWLRAGGNVVASCALCILAAWLGHAAASLLNSRRA